MNTPEIERFDAGGGGAERGTRLRFAGLDQAVETRLGFDEVLVLVETALKEGGLIELPPDDTKRVINPQQLVSVSGSSRGAVSVASLGHGR